MCGHREHTYTRMQSTSSTSSGPTPCDSSIIRVGSDGRLRFTPAQRLELLDAFDRSGLSARAFARSHGVCYQTFINWQRKRREEATITPTHSGPAFAAVFVADWQPAGQGGALRVIRLETYKSQDRVAMDAPRRQPVKL